MSSNKFFHVGEIGESPPSPSEFEPSPFRKAKVPEPLCFEVNIVAHAEERQRKMARSRSIFLASVPSSCIVMSNHLSATIRRHRR